MSPNHPFPAGQSLDARCKRAWRIAEAVAGADGDPKEHLGEAWLHAEKHRSASYQAKQILRSAAAHHAPEAAHHDHPDLERDLDRRRFDEVVRWLLADLPLSQQIAVAREFGVSADTLDVPLDKLEKKKRRTGKTEKLNLYKGLRKLKHPSWSRLLRTYLELF